MASVINDGDGKFRIQFNDRDGVRRTVRPICQDKKDAKYIAGMIESLVKASHSGAEPNEKTSHWLTEQSDVMHARLAHVGLVEKRPAAKTLGEYLKLYFEAIEVKSGTETAYSHTRRCLASFFGESKPLRAIDGAGGAAWREWLKTTEELSPTTIARRVGVARMIFARAVKMKLLTENPFTDVKGGSQKNQARQFFVTRDMANKVMDKCPNLEWKLLFALSRYGGLRCPSEHLLLKWSDIDFANGKILIHSPKTEHHEGKDQRLIPMFPELECLLLEAHANAPAGDGYVIAEHREPNCNLRTQLNRIIRRAGMLPWPKLFHNLRSTRQTELQQQGYPIHVVCAWLGNSPRIAMDHYLQVTEADFERAAQNTAYRLPQPTPTTTKPTTDDSQNSSDFGLGGERQVLAGNELMGAVGQEQATKIPEKPQVTIWNGANHGAIDVKKH